MLYGLQRRLVLGFTSGTFSPRLRPFFCATGAALASRSVAALRVLCTGVSVSRWCTWLWFRLGLRFRESQIYLLKLLWWSLVEARGFVGGHAASRFPGLPVAARDVGGGAWWQRVVGSAARVAGVVKILAPFASYSGFRWCFLPTSLEFSALWPCAPLSHPFY